MGEKHVNFCEIMKKSIIVEAFAHDIIAHEEWLYGVHNLTHEEKQQIQFHIIATSTLAYRIGIREEVYKKVRELRDREKYVEIGVNSSRRRDFGG